MDQNEIDTIGAQLAANAKPAQMTHDLATRIADGRKKAETFNEATTITALMRDGRAFQDVASPDLFIEMADEIDRLRAEADWWKKEGAKLLQQKAALTAQLEKAREALALAQQEIESYEERLIDDMRD